MDWGLNRSRALRTALCAALVALLGASGYAGRQTASPQAAVPVSAVTLDQDVIAEKGLRETEEALERERERALEMLKSILADPRAGDAAAADAAEKMADIAARMEREASLEAALARIGVRASAACTQTAASVFVLPTDAQDEKTRMQILDLAAAVCEMEPSCIKIILVKNE